MYTVLISFAQRSFRTDGIYPQERRDSPLDDAIQSRAIYCAGKSGAALHELSREAELLLAYLLFRLAANLYSIG
jgi:hypothetical protein